jgi:hypothetical protein
MGQVAIFLDPRRSSPAASVPRRAVTAANETKPDNPLVACTKKPALLQALPSLTERTAEHRANNHSRCLHFISHCMTV